MPKRWTAENLTWAELDSLLDRLRAAAERGGGRDEATGYWIRRAELARGIPPRGSAGGIARARADIAELFNSSPHLRPGAKR